ncbi:TPA: hypothetical protein ACQJWO_005648 [Klebsiella pneumoniae]
MRQPDIEIYLKDVSQARVTSWLEQAMGPCTEWQACGQTQRCQAGGISVVWLPRAVGSWHSLLLESAHTPWADDLACARAAHAALQVEVRCSPGGWSEDEDEAQADCWLRVSAEGEQSFIWRS